MGQPAAKEQLVEMIEAMSDDEAERWVRRMSDEGRPERRVLTGEEWKAALRRLGKRSKRDVPLPEDALRRERIYPD